jgi:uncharacterized membrane protein YfhO
VTITTYRPEEVRLQVDAGCAGLLVLSDAYHPGWRAEVNGKDTTIVPTDYLFRGVRVPRGRSTVVFRYEPIHFGAAIWVARIAALLAIVWLLGWVARRRWRAATVIAPHGGSASTRSEPNELVGVGG